jgi:hypothetical protein
MKWTTPYVKPVPGATGRLFINSMDQTQNSTLPFQFESARSYRITYTGCALIVRAAGIDIPKERSSMPKPNHLSKTHNKKDHVRKFKDLYGGLIPPPMHGDLLMRLSADFHDLINQFERSTKNATPRNVQITKDGKVQIEVNGEWVDAQPEDFPIWVVGSTWIMQDGTVLRNVHNPSKCEGRGCPIHHPSAHPLANAPLKWQNGHLLRICQHSIAHWDVDDIAYRQRLAEASHAPKRRVPADCGCSCNCCGLDLR